MNAFWYLLRRTVANTVKQSLKKPALTVLYAVLIIFMLFCLVMAGREGGVPETPQNLDVFAALALAVFALIVVMSVFQGLKQGTAIFSMPDVNFLFAAPLSPRKILLYGVLRKAGILVLASLCLVAQYSNIRINFGLPAGTIGYLMLAYVLCGVCGQVFSADIYAWCAENPARRKRAERLVRRLGILLAMLMIVYGINAEKSVPETLRSFFGADWWNYVPVIGWSRAIVCCGAAGETGGVILYGVLMLLACFCSVIWLMRANSDFFEDVLLSAENAYTVQTAAKEGRMASVGQVSERSRRTMRPLRGHGAAAFFYRALREKQRGSLWFLDAATLTAIAAPVFGRAVGEMEAGLWPPLLMAAYLLIFLGMNNSIAQELTHPYIYLAPAGSFRKLAAISLPAVIKYAVDAAIFAALCAVVLKCAPQTALFGGVVYWSIGVLFTAGVLIVQRLLGKLRTKILVVLLYMLILILLAAPGIVLAMTLESALGGAWGYLLSAAWNLIAAAVITAACRNLLNSMDA